MGDRNVWQAPPSQVVVNHRASLRPSVLYALHFTHVSVHLTLSFSDDPTTTHPHLMYLILADKSRFWLEWLLMSEGTGYPFFYPIPSLSSSLLSLLSSFILALIFDFPSRLSTPPICSLESRTWLPRLTFSLISCVVRIS